jgi:hypothetical protein
MPNIGILHRDMAGVREVDPLPGALVLAGNHQAVNHNPLLRTAEVNAPSSITQANDRLPRHTRSNDGRGAFAARGNLAAKSPSIDPWLNQEGVARSQPLRRLA